MRPERDHLPRPDMTPMIDVVFQLLIFFLVTMEFKTLDMKIEADLPKEAGINTTPLRAPERPRVTARLTRAPDGTTRVRVGTSDLGTTTDPATYRRLVETARGMRARHVGFGNDPDTIDAEVDAAPRVSTGDVIRTIDAFVEADLTHVTFRGTPVAAATGPAPND